MTATSSDGSSIPGPLGHGRRGLMLILASPSGAGKSTLTSLLLRDDRSLSLSVSVTTRPRRPSEVDGVHYRFVSPREFCAMRDSGALLEWAEVHGNLYGTPAADVQERLARGLDVLFDIDTQGTRQLYERCRDDMVTVFILPPSARALEQRLRRRAEDSPATIRRRLATALREINEWQAFDHILINDDLDRCFRSLRSILEAARHRRERLRGIDALVETLNHDLELLLSEEPSASASR